VNLAPTDCSCWHFCCLLWCPLYPSSGAITVAYRHHPQAGRPRDHRSRALVRKPAIKQTIAFISDQPNGLGFRVEFVGDRADRVSLRSVPVAVWDLAALCSIVRRDRETDDASARYVASSANRVLGRSWIG
jgi:hypothetical protein